MVPFRRFLMVGVVMKVLYMVTIFSRRQEAHQMVPLRRFLMEGLMGTATVLGTLA